MASIQMVVMCAYCGRYVRTKECEVPDAWAKKGGEVSHGMCPGCECAISAISEVFHQSIDPHWQGAVTQIERTFIQKLKAIKGGGSVRNHTHPERVMATDVVNVGTICSHPPPSNFSPDLNNTQEVPETRASSGQNFPVESPFQQQKRTLNEGSGEQFSPACGQELLIKASNMTAGGGVQAVAPATFSKQDLIAGLKKCSETDPEYGHEEADELLIKYINDDEVASAFNALKKWYA